MDLNAIGAFVQHVGLPAAMLLAFGWWIVRKDDQTRADVLRVEENHRQERQQFADSHLDALGKVTAALDRLVEVVRDARRAA